MKYEQIAAQLYTLREYEKTEDDVYNTLRKVKEIGFKAVQISGITKMEPIKLRKMLDEFSLVACATHIPFERLKNEFDQVVEEHKILGCRHIAIPIAPKEYRNTEEYIQFVRECTEIGKKLKEHGLTLSYHNNCFELKK